MRVGLRIYFVIFFAYQVVGVYQCEVESGMCYSITHEPVGFMVNHNKEKSQNLQPFVSERVQKLIETMSLREKIGQMTQLDVSMLLNQDDLARGIVSLNLSALEYGVKQYGVGSYLNSPFAGGPIGSQSGFTPQQWISFITELKQRAVEYSNSSLPIIYGLDSVHGANYVYGAVIFPHNIAAAATFNPPLVANATGKIAARDTRLSGISWQFAPVLGIGVNPLWSRFYETFGEDPYVATQFGTQIVSKIEGTLLDSQTQCASCCKHFLGYPDPKSGKDRTDAWIGQRQMLQYFLPSFEASLPLSSSTMINSGSINEIPVHSSKEYLTGYLRRRVGFGGVAVTDYQDIEKLVFDYHLVETYKEAALIAIDAGIDMSMVPLDYTFPEDVYQLVQEGLLSESRIDESVTRILQMKENLGLFGSNYLPDPNNVLLNSIGSESDINLALEIAEESITLLKNDNTILPLSTNLNKVVITGPAANSRGVLSGGWSIHWQGAEDDEFIGGSTILDGISGYLNGTIFYSEGVSFTDVIDIESVVKESRDADVVILCLGEAPEAEVEGNINDLTLSTPQIELYSALSELNVPIILILVEARPRVLGPASNSDAIVMAYLPGPNGGKAIAKILFGDVNPSGKLPFTYPATTNDVGVSYYHMYSAVTSPLYPFGHGLSYSQFSYSSLVVPEIWNITNNQYLTVSVDVSNTNGIPGEEVVLMYISDLYCTVSPEVKRLRRFERVYLPNNLPKTLSWNLSIDDISFINRALQPAIESGTFMISVGDQSKTFELVMNN